MCVLKAKETLEEASIKLVNTHYLTFPLTWPNHMNNNSFGVLVLYFFYSSMANNLLYFLLHCLKGTNQDV